jgi:nucleotide-binding universal stress UspA family protein
VAAHRTAEVVAALTRGADDLRVTIVLAISLSMVAETELDERAALRRNDVLRIQAQGLLEQTAALFAAQGIRHSTRILEGMPAAYAMIREVEAGSYDLIALGGSRGCLEQKGSEPADPIARRLIRQGIIPILFVPDAARLL